MQLKWWCRPDEYTGEGLLRVACSKRQSELPFVGTGADLLLPSSLDPQHHFLMSPASRRPPRAGLFGWRCPVPRGHSGRRHPRRGRHLDPLRRGTPRVPGTSGRISQYECEITERAFMQVNNLRRPDIAGLGNGWSPEWRVRSRRPVSSLWRSPWTSSPSAPRSGAVRGDVFDDTPGHQGDGFARLGRARRAVRPPR